MRILTSSPRLVSWVEVVLSATGCLRWRSARAVWKSVIGVPKWAGSPPTSLSETRRLKR